MVTLEQMREAQARRQDAASTAADAEATRLRALLPSVAAHLRSLGATEVHLFGSLASGRFRADSDVDLATRGLGFHEALRAMTSCAELLGRSVDVVRLEDAPATLVARVEETGVRLP